MARMYRETVASFNKSILTPLGEALFTISPIDADQIPNGYLKSVKVSVIPSSTARTDESYLIVASTNDSPLDASDIITAQATGRGGGTVWLNLKRPVKSSAEEPNRPDGEVYIHLYMNGPFSPVDAVEVNLVAECWGRFLNMAAI